MPSTVLLELSFRLCLHCWPGAIWGPYQIGSLSLTANSPVFRSDIPVLSYRRAFISWLALCLSCDERMDDTMQLELEPPASGAVRRPSWRSNISNPATANPVVPPISAHPEARPVGGLTLCQRMQSHLAAISRTG
jgi:hypothetical protein